MSTPTPLTNQAATPDDLLLLIERQLGALWSVHKHSGNRELRNVLRTAEALIAQRRGIPVDDLRREQRMLQKERRAS